MLVVFLFPIFGWIGAIRIISQWEKMKILSRPSARIAVWLSFFVLMSCCCWVKNSQLGIIAVAVGLNVTMLILPQFILRWHSRHFRSQLLFALDSILHNMRAGRSFQEALAELLSPQTSTARPKIGLFMSEICRLTLAQQRTPPNSYDEKVRLVFREFSDLSRASFRVADRLRAFRSVLAVEIKFVRKSRIATLQARAQALVMAVLFVAGAIYNLTEYGWNEHQHLLLAAGGLFAGGTLWVFRLGKNVAWKI